MLPFLIGGSLLSGILGGASSGGLATTLGSIGASAVGSAAVGSLAKGAVIGTAKTLTLEEAQKLYGAYYIGKQVAKNRERKREREREREREQAAQNQDQGRTHPKIICYIKTDEGLIPVYEE